MKRNIIKSIVFFIVFFIILILLSKAFNPKNNSVKNGMHNKEANGILAEPQNTIDCLIVGDSEAYTSIIPMELWNEYGYTSYVCSSVEQTIPVSIRFLHTVMKKQKPKIVILEANNILRGAELSELIDQILFYKFKIFQYHDRWKKITMNDFTHKTKYSNKNYLKGYNYSNKIEGTENYDYMQENGKKSVIPRSNKIYINYINEFCKKIGIHFIVMSTPSIKNWNYANHAITKDFLEQSNIEFLDLNLVPKEELEINWQEDTRDAGDHLNHKGALKTTKYFGKYLSEKNLLQNHKQDDLYKFWDEEYIEYKKIVEN